ncbi:MAG TPA: MarR family transcriptional regulator, partial [Streptosporangiaceae bacterium]|nr:MarR family transcriptional regulator [Streptosporangiaceae bacterium]
MTVTTAGGPADPGPAGAASGSNPPQAAASGGSLAQPRLRQPGQPGSAARPPLIRAMNEQFLLGHIRDLGPCSRADLARLSGLSKPTVSLALAALERAGLLRVAGQRTGLPGRSARLYEVRPDAGYVLGLDIGHQYVRGALSDLAGGVLASSASRSR